MQIGRIIGATRVAGVEQGYKGLPIRDELVRNGTGKEIPCMTTAWIPDPAELAALNAGASVHVMILGTIPPPMKVGVGEAPTSDLTAP